MASHPTPREPASRSTHLNRSREDLRELFRALRSPRDLAELLDVPFWQFTYLLYRSDAQARYTSMEMKKKSGGIRHLLVPNDALSILQSKLVEVLTAVYWPKVCVHGFVEDRSTLTNAKRHVKCAWVLNIDLKDFFPSVNFGRVRGMFLARPYSLPAEVATVLAQLCCHDNQLPQGAPTSPIVSNMICGRLDGQLLALARKHRLTYTRFADDLTFSTGLREFPPAIAAHSTTPPLAIIGDELRAVVEDNGFSVNPKKSRLQGRTTRQEVTGVTVSRFPNVPRSLVRKTRAMLHAWERFGYEAAEAEHRTKYHRKHRGPHRGPVSFRHVVRGHLAYLAMIRGNADPLVLSLRARYEQLDPEFRRHAPAPLHETVCRALWVLECEEAMVQGTAFSVEGIGLMTCEHVLGPRTHAFRAESPDVKHPVRVVGRSKELDLAVLTIEKESKPALRINGSYVPNMGDQVNAAGFPNYQIGDSGYFSPQRIVSFRRASGSQRALVDGPVAGGMSGGPAVDADGLVIGVVVSGAEILSQANMTERHGFIPAAVVTQFLESLPNGGDSA